MNRLSIRKLLYAFFLWLLWISNGNVDHVFGSNNLEVQFLPLILNQFGIKPTETPTASSTSPRPTRTKTPTPTRTKTPTSQPFRTFTPLPSSTITPTTTLTPTLTFTPTLTPTPTYVPFPEITLIYPTFTPSMTPTRSVIIKPTITQTPPSLFNNKTNQARLGILASVGLVWVLLAVWLVVLIRRTRTNQE